MKEENQEAHAFFISLYKDQKCQDNYGKVFSTKPFYQMTASRYRDTSSPIFWLVCCNLRHVNVTNINWSSCLNRQTTHFLDMCLLCACPSVAGFLFSINSVGWRFHWLWNHICFTNVKWPTLYSMVMWCCCRCWIILLQV